MRYRDVGGLYLEGLIFRILPYFKTLGFGQAVAGTSSLSRPLSSSGANRAAVGRSLMLNLALT